MIANSHSGFSAKANGFASNGYGARSPGGFKLAAVILGEIIFTGLFVFVIASTSRKSMAPGLTGVTVGLMLTLIHLIMIPVDNTSVNPARSLSTAIFQHGWALGRVWVFIVFPVVGGPLGGYAWKVLVPPEDAGTATCCRTRRGRRHRCRRPLRGLDSCGGDYCRLEFAEENWVDTVLPRTLTATMTMIAMNAIKRMYSTRFAPRSSRSPK